MNATSNTDLTALRPRVLRVAPDRPDPQAIAHAVTVLRAGGLVGFPTETFYAIGADAMNPEATAKVFLAKGRAPNRPVSVVIPDRTSLEALVTSVSPEAERLMQEHWPGPLTLVFLASSRWPAALTAGTGTIGIRVPSHPTAVALLARFGGPVTATSANRSGGPDPVDVGVVIQGVGPALDLVLDAGPTRLRRAGGLPSTVVDVTGARPRLIRAGAIRLPALTA